MPITTRRKKSKTVTFDLPYKTNDGDLQLATTLGAVDATNPTGVDPLLADADTTPPLPPAKRGPGRPRGSKSKGPGMHQSTREKAPAPVATMAPAVTHQDSKSIFVFPLIAH